MWRLPFNGLTSRTIRTSRAAAPIVPIAEAKTNRHIGCTEAGAGRFSVAALKGGTMKHDRSYYMERNQDIACMRHEGKNLAEIGKKYEISRERVRQILYRLGFSDRPYTEGQNKALCVYAPHKTTREIALEADVPRHVVYTLVKTRGLETRPDSRSSRRCKYSDEDLLDHLRTLAKQLQKTPGTIDLWKVDGPRQTTYHQRFGSLREAQKRAGLVPNAPHRPSHTSETGANTLT